MGLFSFLNPLASMGGGGDSGGGSSSYGGGFNKSSSSSSDSNSNNVTTTTDNSVTTNTDARVYATETNTLSSWLDQSVTETIDSRQWWDQSQRTAIDVQDSRSWDNSVTSLADNSLRVDVQDSSSRDSSVRTWADNSVTNLSAYGTDAAQIVATNAAMLQAVSQSQGDTARALAKFGADGVAAQADAARSLFATSSAEASRVWTSTMDAAATALDKLMTNTRASVGDTINAATSVGSRVVSANPDAASGANVKIALIGAAAVLIAAILGKR